MSDNDDGTVEEEDDAVMVEVKQAAVGVDELMDDLARPIIIDVVFDGLVIPLLLLLLVVVDVVFVIVVLFVLVMIVLRDVALPVLLLPAEELLVLAVEVWVLLLLSPLLLSLSTEGKTEINIYI